MEQTKAKKLNIELPPASAARPEEAAKKLVLGEPNLQAPSDTSMGIAWTVNVLANGWVEYADNPEFANAKKTVCGGFGVTGFDDRVLLVPHRGAAHRLRGQLQALSA